MLLSLTHNYLFIANQKVASESLHLIAGDDADLAFARIGSLKHCEFDELTNMLDEHELDVDLSNLFVFSVVREPAEWYVSWYNSRARTGLANPDHRRHKVYTGNVSFDEFLAAADTRPRPPMTKVKAQNKFFSSANPNVQITPVPFDRISTIFPQLFPPGSSISEFELFKPAHTTNQSKIVRFTKADLTQDHRDFINTKLYADDYAIYQRAVAEIDTLPTVQPGPADAGAALRNALETRADVSDFAYETAFAEAMTRLYRGEKPRHVRKSLSGFQHIDLDELMKTTEARAERMRR